MRGAEKKYGMCEHFLVHQTLIRKGFFGVVTLYAQRRLTLLVESMRHNTALRPQHDLRSDVGTCSHKKPTCLHRRTFHAVFTSHNHKSSGHKTRDPIETSSGCDHDRKSIALSL